MIALLTGAAYFAGLTAPESYPKMSSLNSGPEGAKLLFDTLANTRLLAVSRNYLPFSQWRPSASTIFLFSLTGADLDLAKKEYLVELETLARANNRLLLCIRDESVETKRDTKQASLIETRWGIQVFKKENELTLDADSSWQRLSGVQDAVEKHFDKGGTIVVALHSDEFSNKTLATEAAVLDRVPALIGKNTAVIFDETHLGIEESGSIAGLARRYRLQGLLAGLLILASLFIWNRSVSFPPPTQFESSQDKQVTGADARSTFAGLIARHLTPRDLIGSCIAEWNRLKPDQRITTELPAKIDPVAIYRQLQESAKGAAARRQTAQELAQTLGGKPRTATVLREFPQSLPRKRGQS
jgi:hypothetical protein